MARGKEFWDGVASGEITSIQVNTFQAFQSPIDGEVISSRKQLREHEKRHNVVQVGDEYNKKLKEMKETKDAGRKH